MTESWGPKELQQQLSGGAALWCLDLLQAQVEARFGVSCVTPLAALPEGVDTLVVFGGGALLDESKHWRRTQRPDLTLVAVPTLWGSGAEVSPIAVRNRDGHKEIDICPENVPDVVVYLDDIIEGLPPALVQYACGDVWAHALEGFLSPVASKELQQELAVLLRELIEMPVQRDPRWFSLSARACLGQAAASVGLVHGIAHVLEGLLSAEADASAESWGHARLCSRLLWPVMRFNQEHSGRWAALMEAHGLDQDALLRCAAGFFSPEDYRAIVPLLAPHWRSIMRDPCTRTNSVLVRRQHLPFFESEHWFDT